MEKRNISAAIQIELEPNEEVAWCGEPIPGAFADGGRRVSVSAILLVTIVILQILSLACSPEGVKSALPTVLTMFLSIFTITVLAVRYFVSYEQAKSTHYAITHDRILIVHSGKTRSVESYRSTLLDHITITEQSDGSGSVLFDNSGSTSDTSRSRHATIGLIGIPDVRGVERVLKQLCLEKSKSSSAS
jgi:hypothetical protein